MHKEEQENKKEVVKEFVTFILLTVAIILPLRFYVAQPFIVSGDSMLPTFKTGEYLIIDELTYNFKDPERGEVIVFKFPEEPSIFFIKRIIGLPNETVEIYNGEVYVTTVNDETFKLEEHYITFTKEDYIKKTLGPNEYYVMGDNRESSHDSRAWGPLEENYIVGRALIRLLPIKSLDILPGEINFNYE